MNRKFYTFLLILALSFTLWPQDTGYFIKASGSQETTAANADVTTDEDLAANTDSTTNTTVTTSTTLTANTDLKLQIAVMSDVHIGNGKNTSKFITALNDYKNIAPNYDVVALVGDITDQGTKAQYTTFMSTLNKNIEVGAKKIITMGNHEFFEGVNSPESGLTDKALMDRFVDKTGMPGVYYDSWVKGYHFIVLGSEESRISNPSNEDNAIISEEQYDWLEKTLPQSAEAKKPIFVFLHQPIDDTVYGSHLSGGLKDARLINILKKYPQVIFFSGHSHAPLNNTSSIYQDGFTMVNTSSVAYAWDEDTEKELSYSQGLLVNVYEGFVEIKSREFTNNTWIRIDSIKIP